jgi:uncharacterized membrane protein YfcA
MMIVGGIVGGYLGAHYAQKMPQSWIRCSSCWWARE